MTTTSSGTTGRPRRSWLPITLGGLALLAVGALALVLMPLPRSEGLTPARAELTGVEAVPVRAIGLREQGAEPLRATGTLEAKRAVTLAFAVPGVLARIQAVEGARVRKGQKLAELDLVPFLSAVDLRRARVDYLTGSLARSQMLLDNEALTPEEFDAQQAELDAATAELRMARWNLQQATLRAPFDGYVDRRTVELGQVIASGQQAVEFLDAEELEVWVAVPDAAASSLRPDSSVEIVAVGQPDLRTQGVVHHRPVRGDARSGSVPVLVELTGGPSGFLSGMVVECRFQQESVPQLTLPMTALLVDNDGDHVLRIVDGRAQRIPVQLGRVQGETVEIRSGLSQGDVIIERAPARLRHGDPVRLVSDEAAR